MKQLTGSDRRLMAEQLGLDKETVRWILVDDLGMRKICAKRVWQDVNATLLAMSPGTPGCSNVAKKRSRNKANRNSKRQSLQFKTSASLRPTKARMSIVFFYNSSPRVCAGESTTMSLNVSSPESHASDKISGSAGSYHHCQAVLDSEAGRNARACP